MIEEKPSDLKLKYRPPTLEQFYGGGYLIPQVETYVANEAKSHAIMITGPSGCGKTTLGRIIARMMGSSLTPPNFQEFDMAQEGGVEAAKTKIVKTVRWMPVVRSGEARIKVYLLDESHLLTRAGAGALLKVIEEPPPFVYFIFCTTDPQKMLDTILTRCQKFEVRPLSQEETQCLVEDVCEAEGIDLPKVVLRRIVAEANGCSREALNLINTVRGLPETVALEAIGGSLETEITGMCSLLLDARIKDKWPEMRRKLEKFNGDPEKSRLGVLTYMRKVVMGERATSAQLRRADDVTSCFWNPFDRNGLSGFILAMRAACNSVSGGEE